MKEQEKDIFMIRISLQKLVIIEELKAGLIEKKAAEASINGVNKYAAEEGAKRGYAAREVRG